LFADKRKSENGGQQKLIDDLYRLIGQRDTELEWMKKNMQRLDT